LPDKYTALSPELYAYLVEHGTREDDVLLRLAEETHREYGESSASNVAIMQIAPDQGAFMTLLVRLMGAHRALELGTFTGYSAICIARGLPDDGTLVTCDLNDEWTAVARRYWAEAGVAERIDLRLGPALETLRALPDRDPFDFAFIDADKSEYPDYYEECLRLLRPGGLVVLDNVFRAGGVVDSASDDPRNRATREVNDRVVADERVDVAMLPVSDGITLALKR
jgi:predicted O-methyltransferase YrrM